MIPRGQGIRIPGRLAVHSFIHSLTWMVGAGHCMSLAVSRSSSQPPTRSVSRGREEGLSTRPVPPVLVSGSTSIVGDI